MLLAHRLGHSLRLSTYLSRHADQSTEQSPCCATLGDKSRSRAISALPYRIALGARRRVQCSPLAHAPCPTQLCSYDRNPMSRARSRKKGNPIGSPRLNHDADMGGRRGGDVAKADVTQWPSPHKQVAPQDGIPQPHSPGYVSRQPAHSRAIDPDPTRAQSPPISLPSSCHHTRAPHTYAFSLSAQLGVSNTRVPDGRGGRHSRESEPAPRPRRHHLSTCPAWRAARDGDDSDDDDDDDDDEDENEENDEEELEMPEPTIPSLPLEIYAAIFEAYTQTPPGKHTAYLQHLTLVSRAVSTC